MINSIFCTSVVETGEGVEPDESQGEETGDRRLRSYDSLDAKQICIIAFGCIIGLGLLLLVFRVSFAEDCLVQGTKSYFLYRRGG